MIITYMCSLKNKIDAYYRIETDLQTESKLVVARRGREGGARLTSMYKIKKDVVYSTGKYSLIF